MKQRYSLIAFLLVVTSLLWATAPNGYYTASTLDGKNTANLRSAFQTIITNGHSVVSYDGLWTAYATTDINPSTGKIWDMYSNCSFTLSTNQCGTYSAECDCYNREHSVPKSWWGGTTTTQYSDIIHLVPTDGYVNNRRSNYPFGEVGTVEYTSDNGSLLGTSDFAGYSGKVFEPIDEYKGDFARIYFYIATRYAGTCDSWTSGDGAVVFTSGGLSLTSYAANLFLAWSRQDPVSAKEIARNDAVYSVQNNRNPFIDFPGLEEYIWGNKTSQTFSVAGSNVTIPTLSSPTSASISNTSAVLGGNISSVGNGTITESGVFYSLTNGFADGAGTKITGAATATGAFTVPVSGLSAGTTYYYKAFATNSAGTGYTSQGTFTTASVVVVAPTISNPAIVAANTTSATLTANISSDGGDALAEKGFYWSTTNGFANGAGTKVVASGTLTGSYSSSIGSLTPATTYYFKGFATNSAGTSYTSQATFTTASVNGPVINAGSIVSSGAVLNFGTVQSATTKSLLIKTTDITGDLTVSVTGTGFSASTATISQANAESGYPLMITLTPVASGAYSGTLTISGGGLVSNYQVSLTGTK